jgi:hypothetical protein
MRRSTVVSSDCSLARSCFLIGCESTLVILSIAEINENMFIATVTVAQPHTSFMAPAALA